MLAALAAALAVTHVVVLGSPIFPVDDAYITAHNAEVLISGRDPNYVGVPALVGATSLAHVALAGIFTTVLPSVWALWVVAWIAAFAYASGLARLAFSCGASAIEAALVIVAGVVVARVPHHLMNGLETGCAMAIATWGLALANASSKRARAAFAVIMGMMPFFRPELAALAGLLWVHTALGILRRRGLADSKRDVGAFALWTAVGAIPLLLLVLINTGSFVPTTVGAKKLFFAEGCAPPAEKLGVTWRLTAHFAETLGLLGLGALFLPLSAVGRACVAFSAALLFAYYKEFPGALGHYEQRYFYVLVPCVIFGFSSVIAAKSRWLRVGSLGLLAAGIVHAATEVPDRWGWYMNTRRFTEFELAGTAAFVREHVPSDAKILVHDAGYIAWATDNPLVDLVGLKTPSSVTYHRDITWATCGRDRNEALAKITAAANPGYIIFVGGWDDTFQFSNSLMARGWQLEKIRDGRGAYDVYRVVSRP